MHSIEDIEKAVDEIEKNGLDAVIYGKKTAAWWVDELIRLAAGNLDEEEGKYLNYVRTVWGNGK